jgi:hypothetical protein
VVDAASRSIRWGRSHRCPAAIDCTSIDASGSIFVALKVPKSRLLFIDCYFRVRRYSRSEQNRMLPLMRPSTGIAIAVCIRVVVVGRPEAAVLHDRNVAYGSGFRALKTSPKARPQTFTQLPKRSR